MAKRKNKQRLVPATTDADERIISTAELLERIPLNRVTIARMVREGRFVAPIQLTTSRIGWRWSAVLAWLNEREARPGRRRTFFRRDDDTGHPPSP
jgi:predicted DNA-binding transcriptional regulator AlpA